MNRGVYGPDDVPWSVQAGRDAASDSAYRQNKEAIDAKDRLTAKTSLLFAHEKDGAIYQDSQNCLHLGFERSGAVYTFGTISFERELITFAALQKPQSYLVRWASFSQFFDRLTKFEMVAPKGCI